ncbi:MAG TPA: transposase [Pirellulales bacterium]|nr:transposase [Pirellulales bacterium]
MKRKTFDEPGHAHTLTFSCYRRFPFLRAERTCNWLAEAIDDSRKRLDFEVWAYVFMPEHVHLIVRPRQHRYSMSDIRKAIKEPVGRKAVAYLRSIKSEWIERIARRRGQRFEHCFWTSGGGYDRNLVEPATLLKMIEYLHLNPVRRELVERAADWKWSSAAWYEGLGCNWLHPDPIPAEWLVG